eukprot:8709684-Alexandrium_andersonii.AAC.1
MAEALVTSLESPPNVQTPSRHPARPSDRHGHGRGNLGRERCKWLRISNAPAGLTGRQGPGTNKSTPAESPTRRRY